MYFLWYLLIGLVAGWQANLLVKGHGSGLVVNLNVGIVGGILGGWILKLLGLDDKYKHYPPELSGGEQQRVALARALVNNPDLLIADEPTTALDVIHRNGIIDLFSLMKANGVGILMVTHDFATALQLGGNVLVMKEGKIIESGEVQSVFDHTTEPYTRSQIEAYSLSCAFTKGAES